MKIAELTNAPDWLVKADTENADVAWCGCGCGLLTWNSGNFLGGNFLGGNFLGGNFLSGNVCGVLASRILTLTHCEGYPKTLVAREGVAWILAGCRFFTLSDAKKHWEDRNDRRITRAMLLSISEVAKQWGLREGTE